MRREKEDMPRLPDWIQWKQRAFSNRAFTCVPLELRSYAQTLLEFLRQAEEFFRTQIDFSFFTRSLPQFMEQVYRHLFPARAPQDPQGID